MLTLHSLLPKDGVGEGKFWTEWDGEVELERVRCRGKADNAAALAHGNPTRDPRKPFGDHPSGEWEVTNVVAFDKEDPTYGWFFFKLKPVKGECADYPRPGIGVHDGPLGGGPVSTLRPAYGCLRLDASTTKAVAPRVTERLKAGEVVKYVSARDPG